MGGFSQGCALSIATMLKYPKAIGGMIGLSGMNAFKVVDWTAIPESKKKQDIPVFLYHGESDDTIKHTIA